MATSAFSHAICKPFQKLRVHFPTGAFSKTVNISSQTTEKHLEGYKRMFKSHMFYNLTGIETPLQYPRQLLETKLNE